MPKPIARLLDRVTVRTVDEAEVVASVLLAIVVAHAIGATNVAWAAFAGYMVMRGHAAETLVRGILRVVGTIAGGLLALALAPLILPYWPLVALALFVVGTASLYIAMTAKRSYAWLFFGLTFAMVVCDKIGHPEIALDAFVHTRILETVAGTLACVAVSLLSTLTVRRRWPAVRTPPAVSLGWRSDAFRHALQAGLALVALVILTTRFEMPALAQSAVTIMAVMMVPVTGIGPSGLAPVTQRLWHRFLGCIAGAALAAIFLFAAQGSPPILIAGTILGVILGRHLENGDPRHRYVGTQFTLAILVTLVPDSYADAAIGPGLDRLFSTLIGMAILEPVLLGWHVVAPSKREADQPKGTGEIGGV